jgi:hypothetical protein
MIRNIPIYILFLCLSTPVSAMTSPGGKIITARTPVTIIDSIPLQPSVSKKLTNILAVGCFTNVNINFLKKENGKKDFDITLRALDDSSYNSEYTEVYSNLLHTLIMDYAVYDSFPKYDSFNITFCVKNREHLKRSFHYTIFILDTPAYELYKQGLEAFDVPVKAELTTYLISPEMPSTDSIIENGNKRQLLYTMRVMDRKNFKRRILRHHSNRLAFMNFLYVLRDQNKELWDVMMEYRYKNRKKKFYYVGNDKYLKKYYFLNKIN